MGYFKTTKICKGWKLEQWSEHTHTYCLTTPQGDNLFAIVKYFLSTLPGGSSRIITNDVFEGTEIFFKTDLKFKKVLEAIVEKFHLDYKEKKRKYGGGRFKKPVLQYTTNWEFIREWEGIVDAAKEFNGNPGALSNAANGRKLLDGSVSHFGYGYYWKYKE